jgi:hypothetical protein
MLRQVGTRLSFSVAGAISMWGCAGRLWCLPSWQCYLMGSETPCVLHCSSGMRGLLSAGICALLTCWQRDGTRDGDRYLVVTVMHSLVASLSALRLAFDAVRVVSVYLLKLLLVTPPPPSHVCLQVVAAMAVVVTVTTSTLER